METINKKERKGKETNRTIGEFFFAFLQEDASSRQTMTTIRIFLVYDFRFFIKMAKKNWHEEIHTANNAENKRRKKQ